jgi:hypothetical protein
MSKKRNNYLILKTLQKMYKGTSVEKLVKDARDLSEINRKEIENANINYSLTDNLVKYYLKKTMKEEKISKTYQWFNFWKIQFNLSESYLAKNIIEDLERIEIFPTFKKEKAPLNPLIEEDLDEDPHLDDCKGPGYLRPLGFRYH